MMKDFFDRIFLESFAWVYRHLPYLPARPLNWLKFDVTGKGLFSERWARQGILPVHLRNCDKWVLLNMGYASQRYTYLYGMYIERAIGNYFQSVLKEGDIFIDIGANTGMLTLLGQHLVGSTGQIFAVEPNPSAYSILCGHMALNRLENVQTFKVALGSKIETGQLMIPHGNKYSQHLPESTWGTLRKDEEDASEIVSVAIETGDNLFCEIPPEINGVCKIDVEGYEMEVLRGMEKFIKTHPRVQYCVEINDSLVKKCSGVDSEYLFIWYRNKGFKPFKLNRDGSISPLKSQRIKQTMDIIFVKD